jgi:hypothetical protein
MDKEHESVVKSFIRRLSDYSTSDLSDIIIKYISYEPETVSAALFVSVEKGIISYDLKEELWRQIESNFQTSKRNIKTYSWEKTNAFIKYVASYTDEEIYNILENPDDIVIDVYFAVLLTAKERELISEEDYQLHYVNAKLGMRTDAEIRSDEIEDFFGYDEPDEPISDVEINAAKEKFWKCPQCNQLVEMEFGICWNCQAAIPVVVEHPDTEDIMKEIRIRKPWNPVKLGLYAIVMGSIAALWAQYRPLYSDFNNKIRFIGVIFGGLVALCGVAIVIFGLYSRSHSSDDKI